MPSTTDIIQVSAYYPPHLGGQENAVQGLSVQLAAAGHRVRVLTSSVGGGAATEAGGHGLTIRRLPAFVFGHAPIMPGFLRDLCRSASSSTLVHLHIGQAFTPEMVWLASKLRRFKYIAELHIDFEPSGPAGVLLPLYKRLILKRVLRGATSIIVLDDKTRRKVVEDYGYRGAVTILSNGIDEAFYEISRPILPAEPPAELRLLCVGRLSKQKNIPTLIEALARTKHPVHLDIVGEGDERSAIQAAIDLYGLRCVTLHGRQSRQATMGFYKRCDALIMPSLYEAQPLVLLEALAARIPVIGTNVIGVGEHLAGAGIVVEPTAEGLADGIDRYYTQYAELPILIARGARLAESFRWRNTLKHYKATYEAATRD